MGTYANFFIEYKEKNGNEWIALSAYYPFKERKIERYNVDKWETIDAEPDLLTADGEGLDKMSYLWRQGHIRDLFSSTFENADFINRGFPDDISSEVKAYFDNKKAKWAKEKEEYEKKYGEGSYFRNEKDWWGESYVTLEELQKQLDKEQKEWEERLTEAFKTKYEDSKILNKLEEVLATVKNKEYKKKKTEEENFADEDIDYYLHEVIYDLFQLNAFIATVSELVENLSHDANNIRLIVWCD